MGRYRKKPVEVEAVQWTGFGRSASEVLEFCGTRIKDGEQVLNFVPHAYPRPTLYVAANDATLEIEPGEWIIKDSLGFYPCKAEVFEQTYEEV